jgi:hypothetical protein
MTRGRTIVLVLVMLTGAAWTRVEGQAGAQREDVSIQRDQAAKATFESVCSTCHDPAVATTTLRSVAEWNEIIDLMIGNGASASDAQFAEIQGYLARRYGKVNVNRASLEELQAVMDVAAPTAQAILDLRSTRRLTSAEDLAGVGGLTSARLQSLRSHLQF